MPSCAPKFVERPARTARPFGLYTVATVVTSTDPHTGCGVEYLTMCGEAAIADDPCPSMECSPTDPDSPTDKVEHEPSHVGCGPFPVYVNSACSLVGDTADDNAARGRELYDLTEQKAVEREFWTRVLADCGPGCDTDDDPDCVTGCEIVTDEPGSLCAALGALEDALADRVPGLGVLHVPAILAPGLADLAYLVRDDGQLETVIGTPVAIGAGYFGPPAGLDPADGVAWIVATGLVRVERGPVMEVSAVGHRRNRRNTLRERHVVVTYECACLIAEVNIEGC